VRPSPPPLAQQHEDAHAKTLAALERLARVVLACQWRAAGRERVTALQLSLLEELAAHPGEGVRELAQRFRLSRATISRAVATLESKGLLVPEPHPADRRRLSLSLTAAGHRLVAGVRPWVEPLRQGLGALSSQQLTELWGGVLALLHELERRGVMARSRMCLTCRFFRPLPRDRRQAYCELFKRPLSIDALRLDCPDFEAPSDPP